jgi:ATP-dependent exoDNAse (exonuclease V) alpha subunit
MRLIREAVGTTSIDTVVRQREAWARKAPQDFARGQAEKALSAFAERGRIFTHDGPRATVEALADRWDELTRTDTARKVLVTAKTNADTRTIAAAIRNRLRQRGALSGPDIVVEAADASGNRHGLRLAAGDHIRFLRRQDELGVINGTEARITAISESRVGQIKITAERDGQRLTFSPADMADDKGRVRLAHAYAVTLFQAQGRTVDHALVLMSGRFDRHDAYVASSRAREATELFLDARTLDREVEQDRPLPPEADRNAARMAYLATRLARQSIKTNAVDYIPEKARAQDKRQELDHEL